MSSHAGVAAVLFVMHLPGCRTLPPSDVFSAPNPIAAYLGGAEIQAESAQASNLCRAPQDLATLPPAELQRSRYADYQGTEGEEFWGHVDASSVRSAARELYAAHKCAAN